MGIPVALHGFGGGGTALNYKVVRFDPGAELPESAKANTIAVFTNVEISSHIFSATEPEAPEDGMVWFTSGKDSVHAFNALKENCLMVYPLYANQYISGAWAHVDAEIYQDGWNGLLTDVVFFGDGAINTDVFGSTNGISGRNGYTIKNGNIEFGSYAGAVATKLFDVSVFNTIECLISHWDYVHIDMHLVDSSGTAIQLSVLSSSNAVGETRVFDVSGYSGDYYLQLTTPSTNASNEVSYSSIKFKV